MPRKKKSPVFVECMMCHRLVPSSEIRHLKVKLPTGRFVRAQICKLCLVHEEKTRFYTADGEPADEEAMKCKGCKGKRELYEVTLILCHECRVELEEWLKRRNGRR